MRLYDFPEIETDVLHQETIVETKVYNLLVYNDDVNTFEFVIDSLIEICSHTSEQAEQCTMIIHYKGKCKVKTGEFDELIAMRNALCNKGISAELH